MCSGSINTTLRMLARLESKIEVVFGKDSHVFVT
jgi:hypothetical protein